MTHSTGNNSRKEAIMPIPAIGVSTRITIKETP
jgi:hypothetical protein